MYSRELDGRVLSLAASGWTYEYTFVLYDHQTESLWYHLPGTSAQTSVNGEFADRELEELVAVKTRWRTWLDGHPDTKYWKD